MEARDTAATLSWHGRCTGVPRGRVTNVDVGSAIMEQQMILSADTDAPELIRCIEDCESCHRICLHIAMNHCLEQGADDMEPDHFRTMFVCAEVCRTTADAMLASFAYHEVLCEACSRVCRECAETCERIGEMDECVEACQRCAESCERMTGAGGAGAA